MTKYAVRHPAARNLWFDFSDCCWTKDTSKRTVFATAQEAEGWATLTQDGGVAVSIT